MLQDFQCVPKIIFYIQTTNYILLQATMIAKSYLYHESGQLPQGSNNHSSSTASALTPR